MADILDLTLRRPSNVKGVLYKHDKDGSLISMVGITSINNGRNLGFHPQRTFSRKNIFFNVFVVIDLV